MIPFINLGYSSTGAVNYLYPNSGFNSTTITLNDSTFNFHMESNGVALLELYIPEISVIINEIKARSGIEIYPNPTDDMVHVTLEEQDLHSMMLFNSSGKHLMNFDTSEFSMKSLPGGIYYLVIITNTGSSSRKVVKW
jgi:hypothetical protein